MEQPLKHQHLLLGLLCCFLTIPAAVSAQSVQGPQQEFAVINYEGTALTQLYGQNALDKIEQIPGFSLSQSTANRGLAAAGGNVLINGAVPASKSESLRQILSQLPKAQIVEIHFYSAGHPFTSASQFTQVVNIITHDNVATTNWQARSKLTSAYQSYRPSELATQISLPTATWQHQINAHYQDERHQSVSTLHAYSAQNLLTEVGREDFFEKLNSRLLSLSSTRNHEHSRLVLSAKTLNEDWQTDFIRPYGKTHAELTQLWQYNESIDTREHELSADWQHQSNQDKQVQFVALHSKKTTDNDSLSRDTGESPDIFKQYKTHQEQVIQFNLNVPSITYKPELGLEISRNQLDATTHTGDEVLISKVSEMRYQPFFAFTHTLNPQWQLYTRINAEHTKLSSGRQNTHRSNLNFIKPLVRLSYEPTSNWDMVLTAQHHVDQLDFNHFVASQNAGFERSQSGNNRLLPSQYSELAAQFNVRPTDKLFMNLKMYQQWQKDIHEIITLDNGKSGLGNAGSATLLGAELALTWDTDAWLSGSQLSVDYQYENAHYRDPLTGTRATTGLTPHSTSIEFRRDMPDHSWGVDIYLPESATYYYQDEVFIERDHIEVNAFAEYQVFASLRVNVKIAALNTAKFTYDQTFYSPQRGEEYDGGMRFDERVDPVITLSLLGTL
ncbi:TonB-dependent receptor [Pseudoalteromonas luteoviolacea]|uniref:TonB-dependent receptor-like beta-barrel domain-containing protein n=1 Tax=Pseudoalteromonas luteoviolacea DSM 6061 TaxID=1365250 RepID=A0A166XHD8_9GAMM|nr:TonB-dependent receptor [Pseudoalteromonas luteoviolacea]KZN40322.1 hypothetical protein N475_12715 [Pseudoalteromonas luteoviolacea DSM 6061]MBE0387898.1 hypothetical protein [Pseudoalteromonas luteoviolacea DSM 6061]